MCKGLSDYGAHLQTLSVVFWRPRPVLVISAEIKLQSIRTFDNADHHHKVAYSLFWYSPNLEFRAFPLLALAIRFGQKLLPRRVPAKRVNVIGIGSRRISGATKTIVTRFRVQLPTFRVTVALITLASGDVPVLVLPSTPVVYALSLQALAIQYDA